MRYPTESFTAAERALLEPHFTNLDRPVFGLVNLPETVKGALFARYSRYPGTLRRLFLEEFAADVPSGARPFDGVEGERAAGLYERIFIGYGDDSIAQVGGAHVACEWVSNVLTKILQRGRLAAYLEQSTRYIPYDRPIEETGGYRYYSDAELGTAYGEAMDELFAIYSRSLETVQAWAAERWPRADGQPEGAWRSSIRAKALDLLRGLLPASTLSHVGIYASGQAYEGLLLRLAASPLPEARAFGEMMLGELQLVMPSFVARVDRPDRGGDWVEHLRERRAATERAVARLGLDRRGGDGVPSVELVHVDGTEDDLLAASLYESAGTSESEIRRRIARPRPDRARGADRRAGGRAPQPPPSAGPRLGGGPLPIRDRLRLRRIPRPAAPPDADLPVAAARSRARRRGPGRGARGGRRRRVRARARDLAARVRPPRGGGDGRRGPLRALPRLPDPLRARPQRARGDAPLRASLGARGPPDLSRRGPGDARADRGGPSRRSPRRCATSTPRPSRAWSAS